MTMLSYDYYYNYNLSLSLLLLSLTAVVSCVTWCCDAVMSASSQGFAIGNDTSHLTFEDVQWPSDLESQHDRVRQQCLAFSEPNAVVFCSFPLAIDEEWWSDNDLLFVWVRERRMTRVSFPTTDHGPFELRYILVLIFNILSELCD